MSKVLLVLLILVSLSFAQFELHDYTIRHFTNPLAENVTNYIYFYWEGQNMDCPLVEGMTYDEVMALPHDTLALSTTTVDTIVSGRIVCDENGFWHRIGCIAENNLGQKSTLALSPYAVRPLILETLTRVRGMIIIRNP